MGIFSLFGIYIISAICTIITLILLWVLVNVSVMFLYNTKYPREKRTYQQDYTYNRIKNGILPVYLVNSFKKVHKIFKSIGGCCHFLIHTPIWNYRIRHKMRNNCKKNQTTDGNENSKNSGVFMSQKTLLTLHAEDSITEEKGNQPKENLTIFRANTAGLGIILGLI
jgi:hypothetical protein